MTKIKRDYKSRMFTMIFSDKKECDILKEFLTKNRAEAKGVHFLAETGANGPGFHEKMHAYLQSHLHTLNHMDKGELYESRIYI